MQIAAAMDPIATLRAEARRAAARGSLLAQLWRRLVTAQSDYAERRSAAMLLELGQPCMVELRCRTSQRR
jgi:hypothetical protein